MADLISFLSPVGGLLLGKKPREAIAGSFIGPVAKASPGFKLLFPDKKRKARQSFLAQEMQEQSALARKV